jgi:hypothetical protein
VKHLIANLFGCWHKNYSRAFSIRTADGGRKSGLGSEINAMGHYVVCLECGKRLAYDWNALGRVEHGSVINA